MKHTAKLNRNLTLYRGTYPSDNFNLNKNIVFFGTNKDTIKNQYVNVKRVAGATLQPVLYTYEAPSSLKLFSINKTGIEILKNKYKNNEKISKAINSAFPIVNGVLKRRSQMNAEKSDFVVAQAIKDLGYDGYKAGTLPLANGNGRMFHPEVAIFNPRKRGVLLNSAKSGYAAPDSGSPYSGTPMAFTRRTPNNRKTNSPSPVRRSRRSSGSPMRRGALF